VSAQAIKPHWSFWLIAILILFWNAMGIVNYFMQMSPEGLQSFSENHRAAIAGRPVWATTGFAIAVFGGTLASILLLLRKPIALAAFAISLLGTIVMMTHIFPVLLSLDTAGIAETLMTTLMPIVVAGLFVWYVRWAIGKGWLN
jgi:hypothetical protein